LCVKYKRGKRKGQERVYQGIPPEAYHEILKADSHGKMLLRVLKQHKQEEIGFWSFFKRILGGGEGDVY